MAEPASDDRRREMVRFCAVFVLLCAVFYTLINYLPSEYLSGPINRYTAETTGALLSLVGVAARVNGVVVSAEAFSIRIISECSPIFVLILFGAFVAAYPAAPRHRLFGLMAGGSVLVVVNQLRIVLIFLIGLWSRTVFQYAHVYIGQIFMIVVTLTVCIVWLRTAVGVDTRDAPFSFLLRFVAYSSLPFALWLLLDEGYVMAHFHLVKAVIGLMGYPMKMPDRLDLYPHTFNTFHLIAFAALVLATRSVDRARKIRWMAVGLLILTAAHFLFRLHQILYLDFHVRTAFRPFIALIIINQWILPFALWLAMVRRELFASRAVRTCPICGAEKVGLAAHIRAKHGEGALKSAAVQALLR